MTQWRTEAAFGGRLLMVGFGCIGQGVLPLLLRHIEMRAEQILIVEPDPAGMDVAREFGAQARVEQLSPGNFREVLEPLLRPGDFLLNLSVDVSSLERIALCQERGALYLDTCIEPWAGGHVDTELAAAQRTNYSLREQALALRRPGRTGPSAVLTHGANPGLVSHFVKQALLDICAECAIPIDPPRGREDWARLAHKLRVRTIHIAERDTQVSSQRKCLGEFVNTWSAVAFVGEGSQPAELGWGSHERHFPPDARRHESGSRAAIFLQRPGAGTRVRSWTPLGGPMHGFLITHAESISIADYLTLGDADRPIYRPTVHYAYHPCDDAVLSLHELAGNDWRIPARHRILKDDIVSGVDELGVLLMGHPRGAYWYGSQLSIDQARAACPHNSATSLQVTAAVMAGVIWAMRNPDSGIIEPDEMPFREILGLCRPYLGDMVGAYSSWTPLARRGTLFPEDIDSSDPWQFKNFRVV